MRRSTLTALLIGIAFLIVCCFFTNGHAQNSNLEETTRGKIEMNLPDAPVPKVEINLDKSLLGLFINFGIASNPKLAGDGSIDLSEYTGYAEMLKGASIRAYDKEMKDLNRIVGHYRSTLENEKWEHLVKIRDKFDLSLLYSEKPGIVNGIFLMFTDDGSSGFVNIYGEIDFQKLGTLFGQLLESNSEEAISETVRNWIKAPMPHRWEVKLNAEKPDHALKSETTATNR
jgi:hypothetical protein